jgi:hypothetical protein
VWLFRWLFVWLEVAVRLDLCGLVVCCIENTSMQVAVAGWWLLVGWWIFARLVKKHWAKLVDVALLCYPKNNIVQASLTVSLINVAINGFFKTTNAVRRWLVGRCRLAGWRLADERGASNTHHRWCLPYLCESYAKPRALVGVGAKYCF